MSAQVEVRQSQCAGVRGDGEPCGSRILVDGSFCNRHSPTATVDPVEFGRQGGVHSGIARREQGRSIRDRLREQLEDRAEEIVDLLLEAGKEDWRAIIGAIEQGYGRAAVEGGEQPIAVQLVSVLAQAAAARDVA